MKKILILSALLISLSCKSQFMFSDWDNNSATIIYFVGFHDYRHVMTFNDTTNISMLSENVYIKSLDSSRTQSPLGYFIGVNNKGKLQRNSLSSLNLNSFINGPGYITPATLTGTMINTALGFTVTPIASQAGNSGKVLSTNGTSTSWITPGSGTVSSVGLTSTDFSVSNSPVTSSGNITTNLNTSGISAGSYNSATYNSKGIATAGSSLIISAPSVGNSITSGTAFQPRSGGSCSVIINSNLGSGLAAVTGTVVIAMSSTQNGTYSTVSTDGLILSLLNTSLDRSSSTILVPSGWWVKVTYSVTGVGAALTGTYTKFDL